MWQCQLSQPDCRCYRVDGYSLLKRLPLHPLIGPRCPLQSVGQWLDSIGLVQYENHLLANGFDNVQFMVSIVPANVGLSHLFCSSRWFIISLTISLNDNQLDLSYLPSFHHLCLSSLMPCEVLLRHISISEKSTFSILLQMHMTTAVRTHLKTKHIF